MAKKRCDVKKMTKQQTIALLNRELTLQGNTTKLRDATIRDLRATVITLTKQIEAANKPWWRVW